MIKVATFRDVKEGEYDYVYAIVRSMKSSSDWIYQLEELSPSPELYKKTMTMKDNKIWDQETFDSVYVPQFLREMHSKDAREQLNGLAALDKRFHRKIALVCYCTEEETCHRCIIAGLLKGAGCDVVTKTGNDYSKYFDMYKRMVPKKKEVENA